MVLYHADGTVVKTHDARLEREAHSRAEDPKYRYTDQIDPANSRRRNACDAEDVSVRIIIDQQWFKELYFAPVTALKPESLSVHNKKDSPEMPEEGLDRRTLMACSSTAYDFFTFEPSESVLHLPVSYPRKHIEGYHGTSDYATFSSKKHWGDYVVEDGKKYVRQVDDQLAYIRYQELKDFIFPWLKKMKPMVRSRVAKKDLPTIDMPDTLLEKIHLYNVMLQLGISTHFQQPLIDQIVFDMYQRNLSECHLDTLEMTVGRFYSRGVPILDPVINHLIGTYAFRTFEDRSTDPDECDRVLKVWPPPAVAEDEGDDKAADEEDENLKYFPDAERRSWLTFNERLMGRKDHTGDTASQPPKVEVIGNCIRHWSGIRRFGSTAAAHTGYPLNVGRVTKYYRRRATDPIRKHDKLDYSTYRLHNLDNSTAPDAKANFEYFRNYRPGNSATALPWKAAGSTAPSSTAPADTGSTTATAAPTTTAGATGTAGSTGHTGATE